MLRSALALLLLVFSLPLHAQSEWARDLRFGMWPFAGDDPTLASTEDLEPFRNLIGDRPIVALGESYHTSGGFYRLKHRLFRYLVEEMGFRAFAIESGWEGGEYADQYVQSCAGTAENAIKFHINVWQSTEYADLVRWMCQWNSAHPNAADKVHLFGFDIQQPYEDGRALIGYLSLIGIPQSDPRSKDINQCEGVVSRYPFGEIPQAVHERCLAALSAVEQHLTTNREDLVRRTSQIAYDRAMLRVVGLRGWQNSVYIIKHDFAAGFNARDEAMAYAFHAVRAMHAPNAKTVIWAANMHVAQTPLVSGEVPFGSYLATTFGDDYVSFAITAYDAEIDFPGYPCGPTAHVPGSVEERLMERGESALIVDTKTPFLRRKVYPISLNLVRPWLDYDGILWLRYSPKMHPLVWPSCS